MMNILDSLCALGGISAAGVCELCQLMPALDEAKLARIDRLVPGAASVFVVLFPYFAGDTPGNLSLYARGRDYHAVIRDTLAPFAVRLTAETGCRAVPLADDSPLPEVRAARLAGVGQIGENGLIFDPDYGSWVFIGTILTDLPFSPAPAVHRRRAPTPPPEPSDRVLRCNHCGACRRVCPLGALDKEGCVDEQRCLSALTQQGGELSAEAADAVRRHPLIWGCDLCQRICPLNRHVPETDNPAFRDDLIASLSAAELDGLTRRQFAEAYPDRAFTWRGPAPLRRNLKRKEEL